MLAQSIFDALFRREHFKSLYWYYRFTQASTQQGLFVTVQKKDELKAEA
jgi:hypothetical protein